jgi:hypothetical protein
MRSFLKILFNDFIYDEEVYLNVFTIGILEVSTLKYWHFEISDRKNESDSLSQMLSYIIAVKGRLVGYNNIHFDYPILHVFMTNYGQRIVTARLLYRKCKSIIDATDSFENAVKYKDILIPQVDLLKIHHFDNKGKRTSLKSLEIAMRMDSVKDLPFEPGTNLTYEQIDKLIKYMAHDIRATYMFYNYSMEKIQFREKLSIEHGRNFTNFNDTKIGKEYFEMHLEKAGIPCYTKNSYGERIPRQTHRGIIDLKDCILPCIKFERNEFRVLHGWLMRKSVDGTKEVLSNIDYDEMLFEYIDPKVVRFKGIDWPEHKLKPNVAHTGSKLVKLGIYNDCLARFGGQEGVEIIANSLTLIIDGFPFVFGTGGLHGSVSGQTVVTDAKGKIVDWDVKSFYPNLSIVFGLFPEHLSKDFCNIFKMLYEQRIASPKDSAINAMLKLALNGVYGNSNNLFSVFYDPKFMLSITISGQLILCMLIEQLMKIKGLKVIQANTDGVTVKCPHDSVDFMGEVCQWWEGYTDLVLESAVYTKMIIKNVNAYIGVFEDGKLKRKKSYCHMWNPENKKDYDLEWHKDMSSLVIPKAAEAYLIRGVPIEEFIYSHQDNFDFMLRAKVNKSSRLYIGNDEIQRTSRYFVTVDGQPMSKISVLDKKFRQGQWKRKTGLHDSIYNMVMSELMKRASDPHDIIDSTGRIWDDRINTKNRSVYTTPKDSICAGWKTQECNDSYDFNRNRVNYAYYIQKAYDLVNPVKDIII